MGRILIVTFIIVTSISSLIWGCGENDKPLTPPEPNVVATFDGGKVTIEQLEEKYQSLMPCCRGRYKGLEGRKILIQQMVFPQIISRFIKEKKIDLRGEIRERLGDITDEMNLSFLHMKIHEEILNAEDKYEDLRREYEFRKKRLEGEPLSERHQRLLQLHQELHPRLAEDVEKYLQRYIERLKSEARITKNFDVLSISVSDQELRDFYEEHAKGYHANEYKDPAKAKISEIRIKIENPAKESEARERAEKALAELRSGESFDQVAKRYSQGTGNGQHGSAPIWVTKGSRGKNFDNMVFSLFSGQISKVFRDGDSFYIVKLEAKTEERLKSLQEIYDQLRLEYQWEKGEKYLQENRDKVLFTIDGKPYTIGDLLNQYYKVTPPHKCKHEEAFAGVANRPSTKCEFSHLDPTAQREMADRMIERELVVEDTYNQMINIEYKKEIDQVIAYTLYPIFHSEEMDKLINVTDKMVEEHYKKHKEQYTTPARAKISYILIKGGRSPEEQEKAFKKAKEVHRKLKPPFYLLKKGEDFSKVAREYSEDEETAAKGGEFAQNVFECRNVLEYITAHGFHKKIFELKPGEISDVFEYNGDYYIVKLRELEERKQKPLSEVNDIIGKELTEQEHQKVMKTWTEDLLKSANLVIYDSVLRTLSMEEEQKKEISGS